MLDDRLSLETQPHQPCNSARHFVILKQVNSHLFVTLQRLIVLVFFHFLTCSLAHSFTISFYFSLKDAFHHLRSEFVEVLNPIYHRKTIEEWLCNCIDHKLRKTEEIYRIAESQLKPKTESIADNDCDGIPIEDL